MKPKSFSYFLPVFSPSKVSFSCDFFDSVSSTFWPMTWPTAEPPVGPFLALLIVYPMSYFLTSKPGFVRRPRPPLIPVAGSYQLRSFPRFFLVRATVRVTIVSSFSYLSFSNFLRVSGDITTWSPFLLISITAYLSEIFNASRGGLSWVSTDFPFSWFYWFSWEAGVA